MAVEAIHQLIGRVQTGERAQLRIVIASTKCGHTGSIAFNRLDPFESVGLSAWTSEVTCPACLDGYGLAD